MNVLGTLSPLMRRSAQAPWTCNACLRRRVPRLGNGFATKPHPRLSGANADTKLHATSRGYGNGSGNAGKSKRRRRIVGGLVGGALVLGAAVTVSDEAKHAWAAVQRSGRVLGTLFVNVKEYVALLWHRAY